MPKGKERPAATCHPDRPHDSFGLCDPCYQKSRYYKNPDRSRERLRDRMWRRDLKRAYGITPEQWMEMHEAQGGRCAICYGPPLGKTRLSVDHNHETGRVRALLCDHCNQGIGHFREDPDVMRRAAEYIEKHRAL